MTKHSAYDLIIAIVFTILAVFVAALIFTGCSEDSTYISPTQPCCDDGCTSVAHSDPCHPDCLTGNNYTICFNGKTMKIKKADWDWYKARGAVKGKCARGDDDDDDGDDDDDDSSAKVCICHIPPGNPSNLHTICVGEAAVPAHLAHGDYLGECQAASSLFPVG